MASYVLLLDVPNLAPTNAVVAKVSFTAVRNAKRPIGRTTKILAKASCAKSVVFISTRPKAFFKNRTGPRP